MIHIISKEYYLKNRTKGKLKKILIKSIKFPNIQNKFFMKDGICFIYLMKLGFLIVPEDSGFTEDILKEEIDCSNWYIEKYNKQLNLTKNYIRSFPSIYICTTTCENKWFLEYTGYVRIWNTLTKEDFIFYKYTEISDNSNYISSSQNSYLCKLITSSKVEFPINVQEALEFNNLIKDIVEWT